jgi:aspartate/methionine/tyrosine aminotransferase
MRGVTVPGTEGINIWVPVHDETAAMVRLASQGIGVAPGAPFRLGPPVGAPDGGGHLRVTVGAAGDDLDALADALADAALAGGRPARAR